MDLWIRSQDRKSLSKAKNIKLDKYIGHKENVIITNDYFELGTYKTEQRALEVLDEIIDLMLPVKTSFDENGEYSCKGCFANKDMMYYEMPQE